MIVLVTTKLHTASLHAKTWLLLVQLFLIALKCMWLPILIAYLQFIKNLQLFKVFRKAIKADWETYDTCIHELLGSGEVYLAVVCMHAFS